MDVVIGRVVIDDLDVLVGHHANHVRAIHAALLGEFHGSSGHGPLLVGHAGFDPHEHVLEGAVSVDHYFFGLLRRTGMRARKRAWPTYRWSSPLAWYRKN